MGQVYVRSNGYLLKNEKKVQFKTKIEKTNPNYIGTINKSGDEYHLTADEDFNSQKSKTLDERSWIVIRNTYFEKENSGYKLREGDIIKLGKVMFKVREVKVDEKLKKSKNEKSNKSSKEILEINNEETKKINVKKKRKNMPICRICLMEDNEEDNPLINPCNCIGSVRFIHILCLRRWLKSKITTKNFNFLMVNSYKSLECEICKKTMPERIRYHGEVINLIDFQKPDDNYIMLESISREKRDTCYLYVIHMKDKNVIKLGRANDSDVRMTDISVSRNHAFLKLVDGFFFLEDNFSKFGSLVLVQNELLILPYKQIGLQCGKLFLSCYLTKTLIAWLTCYSNKKLIDLTYIDYLENKTMIHLKNEEKVNIVNTDFSNSTHTERLDSRLSNAAPSKKSMDDARKSLFNKDDRNDNMILQVENATHNDVTSRAIATDNFEQGHNFITTALNATNHNGSALNFTNIRDREIFNIIHNESNTLLIKNNYNAKHHKKVATIKSECTVENVNEAVFKHKFSNTIVGMKKKESDDKLLNTANINRLNNRSYSNFAINPHLNNHKAFYDLKKNKFIEFSLIDEVSLSQFKKDDKSDVMVDIVDFNFKKEFYSESYNNHNYNKLDAVEIKRKNTANYVTDENQNQWLKNVVDNLFKGSGKDINNDKVKIETLNTINKFEEYKKIDINHSNNSLVDISDYDTKRIQKRVNTEYNIIDKQKVINNSFQSDNIDLISRRRSEGSRVNI